MALKFETTDERVICNLSPAEWAGSDIQAVVLLADYSSVEEAQEAAKSLAEALYASAPTTPDDL